LAELPANSTFFVVFFILSRRIEGQFQKSRQFPFQYLRSTLTIIHPSQGTLKQPLLLQQRRQTAYDPITDVNTMGLTSLNTLRSRQLLQQHRFKFVRANFDIQ
jgi:hypothetical protein